LKRIIAPSLHFLTCILNKKWTSGHTSRLQKYRINYTITTIIP